MPNKAVVCCDFDGTIVEHKFPDIGRLLPGAIAVLKEIKSAGHQLVIWTCRENRYKEEAVAFLVSQGVKPDAVNQNVIDVAPDNKDPRKVFGNIYIDDRNLGGFPGWSWARSELVKSGILSA